MVKQTRLFDGEAYGGPIRPPELSKLHHPRHEEDVCTEREREREREREKVRGRECVGGERE